MVKYCRDALALLVFSFSCKNAMCWSVGPNSPGTRILDRSHVAIGSKRSPSLTTLNAVDPSSIPSVDSVLNSLNAVDPSSISSAVSDVMHSLKATVLDEIPFETINEVFLTAIETAKTYATDFDETLLSSPFIGPVLTSIQEMVAMIIPIIGQELASLPPSVGLLASFIISYTVIGTVQSMGRGPPLSSPYPLGRYDANSAGTYFANRLGEMAERAAEITARSGAFGLMLLSDVLRSEYCLHFQIFMPMTLVYWAHDS